MSRQPSSIPAIDRPARSRRPALAGGIPPRIFAICLTSILVAVHYTNYGPLIPTLMHELHISSGQTGLFSTFLFAGLAVMYIPAGTLADCFGQRPVLLGSSILFVLGSFLLPLLSSLSWILTCIAIGTTIPYASVFNEAAHLRGVGKGVAQGLVSVISTPPVLLGPPLIGLLFAYAHNFVLAFGFIMFFGCVAITASFLAGPAARREGS